MINAIDRFLDGITMYKVILYGLIIVAFIAIFLGTIGILPYKGYQYSITLVLMFSACWLSNTILAKLYRIPTNSESSYITGLILFFLLSPIQSLEQLPTYLLAAIMSMASKYFIALHRKHIFNPAAFTAVVLGLLGSPLITWWVGSLVMLPAVAILGLFLLRKVRRFRMFFAFLISAIASITGFGLLGGFSISETLPQIFTSWPIIFFGTVMLTEPLTTPPTNVLRILYGIIVGILFGSQFHIGPLFATPELSLVLGNIFSYAVSSKKKLLLSLKEKRKIAGDMYEFIFVPKGNFSFSPGQYMEWTLGHKGADIRGNRRYFTVASAPTEDTFRLGIRFPVQGSSFKKTLLSLSEKSTILAGQLAGDFTLPKDASKKLVFLAGGIGVTPFRSMVKYLIDKNEKRDVMMFFSNKDAADIIYKDIFDAADKKLGMRTIYTVTDTDHIPTNWKGEKGRVDQAMIEKYVPDYKQRIYYISGPHPMVTGYKTLLKSLGIPSSHIKIDYFPGFV